MKRYRPLAFDFDTRSHTLLTEIPDKWDPQVQEVWRHNKQTTYEQLRREFGEDDLDVKLRNFADHGGIPLSVIAGHNSAFRQIRNAFVISSYFPALTAACALGERILNDLVLGATRQD